MGYYKGSNFDDLVVPGGGEVIDLPLNGAKMNLTILLKANTSFYISSNNWLPDKLVELFPNATAELIKNINVSFLLSPFISDADMNNIPTPNLNANDWDWVQRKDLHFWKNPKKIKSENLPEYFSFNSHQIVEGWIKIKALKS